MKKPSKRTVTYSIVAILLLCVLYTVWSNFALQTTVYEISLKGEDTAFSGLNIVQISDLHNVSFGKEQKKLLKTIAKQKPDIIAVTGDLIDSSNTDIENAICLMREAANLAPVYYVPGNHEAWSPTTYDELKKELIAIGVHVLENESIEIEYHGKSLTCIGVQDPAFVEGSRYLGEKEVMNKVLNEIQSEGFTLLLSHRPELFELYVEKGYDLVLSGHAHGGQFRLPFLGGLIAPDQGFFPTYTSGTFTKNNTTMIVSRGLGNSIIPIRVLNRPEIVCIRLQEKAP